MRKENHHEKTLFKLLSFILILALCANAYIPVIALPESIPSADEAENIALDDVRLSSYNAENMPSSLRAEIFPNGISGKSVSPVNAEDLYSVTVDNGDGTNTVNIFKNPIKYVTDSGEIKFYTHTLERISDRKAISTSKTSYTYKNEEGDVKTYYSDNIQTGILLQYKDHSISMAPLTDSSKFPAVNELTDQDSTSDIRDTYSVSIASPSVNTNISQATFACDTNKIMYHNVLTNGITYEYMPIPNGIKENIILTAYNNINAFRFTVNIGDLVPEKMSVFGEGIRLIDPDAPDSEAIIISPIYAYDSVGHVSYEHAMYLTETRTEGEYILTVVADREFLESPTTVYPVTIDPTIYPETTEHVADTFVSEDYPDNRYYFATFMPVGNDSYYGESEAFIQIKDLSRYSFISGYSITEAKLRLDCYYTTGTEDNPVQLYAYSNSSDININTITWNSRPNTGGAPYGAANGNAVQVRNTTIYQFDITDLVSDWFKYEYDEGGRSHLRSLRLKMVNSTDDPHYATFRSTEWGTTYPYFAITYEPSEPFGSWLGVQIINMQSGLNLGASQSNNYAIVQHIVDNDDNQTWRMLHLGNGIYRFENQWPYYLNGGRKFLSVSEVNDVVDLYYESDTLLTQRFYIIPCYDIDVNQDGYRIVPVYQADQSGGNKALGTAGSFSEGSSITYYTYDSSSYEQKWQFYEAYVNVDNYYDNGALTRWGLTESQIQSNDQGIGYFTDIAEKLYLEVFDIYINHNTPQLLTTYADNCTGSSNIDALNKTTCDHGLDHKTEACLLINIGGYYYSDTPPRIIPVLWTGHRMSDIDYSPEHRILGKAYNKKRIIMYDLDTENGFSSDQQKLCAYLHELAHCFGAVDSYCFNQENVYTPCTNPNCATCYTSVGYSEDCIMSRERFNMTSYINSEFYSLLFCSKCSTDIEEYISTLY